MSPAAKSVFVDGVYLGVLSLVLLVDPNFLLQLFRIEPTTEVWIRVVGMLVLILAILNTQMALQESVPYFWLSVYTRSFVILFFIAFVLLGWVSPMLILFGAVDVVGAGWTWWALRSK